MKSKSEEKMIDRVILFVGERNGREEMGKCRLGRLVLFVGSA
jgi:hypothetical protein